MKSEKKISETGIKQKLVNDADNPERWEEPITVPPSRAPRPEWYGRTRISSRMEQAQIRRVLEHYESQTDEEADAEIESGLKTRRWKCQRRFFQ